MAIFQNQASITFGGVTRVSNITTGEIVGAVTISKTAVVDTYPAGGTLVYVVNIRNTGENALAGLTLTDDLGAYEIENDGLQPQIVVPLTYVEGSATVIEDGVPQPAPAVSAGETLTITGIDVPANGVTTIIYLATANEFAPLGEDGQITNTAEVTGPGVGGTVSDSATVTADAATDLTIAKSVNPTVVTENSRVTYTFDVENTGAEAAAEDGVVIRDTFDPILTDLVVTLDGETLPASQYTYNQTTGEFATVPGALPIPGATYAQDPDTGVWTVDPGSIVVTVSGII